STNNPSSATTSPGYTKGNPMSSAAPRECRERRQVSVSGIRPSRGRTARCLVHLLSRQPKRLSRLDLSPPGGPGTQLPSAPASPLLATTDRKRRTSLPPGPPHPHGHSPAGPPLRRAHPLPEPRLHPDRGAHSRPG